MNGSLDQTLETLPMRPGVYVFRDRRAKALYVGRAAILRRRVRSYWGTLDGRRHLRRMVPRIERDLIARLDPPFNRILGVEVEVYIRLREDGALHVVHDTLETGARHFGPYLGGRAVHDAAIALRMLYPLEPSSRAMAAARGSATLEEVVVRGRLIALLTGDREELAAATARLLAMRDAASERLAFEFASDVQTRVAALAWISEAPCASPRRPY